MRKHGKPAALVTCLATISLMFVYGQAEADFVVTPPVPMDGDPVLGVRITAFSNSDTYTPELIVGIPPLNDGLNEHTKLSIDDWSYLQGGCNRLNVTFSSGTLTLMIGHGTDCYNPVHWHDVAYADISSYLSEERLAAYENGLNVVQVNTASLGTDTNIDLKNLEWEGVYNFGDFYSNGQNSYSWSLADRYGASTFISPSAAISFAANLVLSGTFTQDSYVELLFGKFTPPNQPPDCINVSPSISTLWPPNGEFWEIGVTVSDPDSDSVTVQVTGIRQDEPVCDTAGPCQADGMVGSDPSKAKIRAKRNPVGNGRVYTIDFAADDGRNGTCAGQVVVGVPKNRGKNGVPVDDGPLFSSFNTIP